MLPEKTINIPSERPPLEEWDERERILDPTERKPAEWDQPEFLLDPHATQPEDWDEAEDGEWIHPVILNPNFKGEWVPSRTIPNPNFKGIWREESYDNPDYKPDPNLYVYKDIGYVGIESWQEHSGTIVDNILLTDDLEGALRNGTEIQRKSFDVEEKAYFEYCDRIQKVRISDMERIQKEAKAFKKRMKKMEL